MVSLIYYDKVDIQVTSNIQIVTMCNSLYRSYLYRVSQIAWFSSSNNTVGHFVSFQILTNLVYQFYSMCND